MSNPNGFIRTMVGLDLDQKQRDALDHGGLFVVLTPDDILTLKLLRDEYRTAWQRGHNKADSHHNRTNPSQDHALETLESILKQVS